MVKFIPSIITILLLSVTLSCSHTHNCMVMSDPPGARISINNEYQGDTPCIVRWSLKGGGVEVSVEAAKDGYLPQMKKVERDVSKVYFVLQPASSANLASPKESVLYQEPPVPLKEVAPEYPPLALQNGIEATVWVKVLVDTSGKVRDAQIFKDSGTSYGFEEAALKAVYSNEYKPALYENKPVAVWVVFPVKFSIR